MAQIISLNLSIPVSVIPANEPTIPLLLRGAGFVAKFNGGFPLSVPVKGGTVDILSAYARGKKEEESLSNLGEAIETALRQIQQGDLPTKDITLSVGANQPALVRFDLLRLS